MTAVLDLHPDAGHPAWALVTELHTLLDERGVGLRAAGLGGVRRVGRRGRPGGPAAGGGEAAAGRGRRPGPRGRVEWDVGHRGLAGQADPHPGAAAAGQVALATILESLPETGAALDAGEVSPSTRR
ncbi:MAG: hypothetical protein R2731_18155 [Nocardioides sp.]